MVSRVRAYLGMVTPAFSQAWIRAEPAPLGVSSSRRLGSGRSTFDRDLLAVWGDVSTRETCNGHAMLTNCQFDLGVALWCRRKGPRRVGGPPARPPSRTCQRVSEHRVALTE